MQYSSFGEKFSSTSGIQILMDDLGNALSGDSDMLMLGGGNPAHIPELESYFQQRLLQIANTPQQLRKLVGIYDPPQGDIEFVNALAAMFRRTFSWPIRAENIALTNGSQAAFFMLFNLFGGIYKDGSLRQIKLPVMPEYIGYNDSGLVENLFSAEKPSIELIGDHQFKYHVDFEALDRSASDTSNSIGAVCVSRPTNPTGNVLTDQEISRLTTCAKQKNIPLIIDGAYGSPFPNLIYTESQVQWDEHVVLCLSLSKFGLPAARTGIVIASEEVILALSRMNAILNLATGSFGSIMATELAQNNELIRLSDEVVRPFYMKKAQLAEALLHREMKGLPYRLHKVEGAMFLWLWLQDLAISSEALYQRLKTRGVLVVPGHYFFPGLTDAEKNDWPHCQQCIRITYAQDDSKVAQGLKIIADEIRSIYEEGSAN